MVGCGTAASRGLFSAAALLKLVEIGSSLLDLRTIPVPIEVAKDTIATTVLCQYRPFQRKKLESKRLREWLTSWLGWLSMVICERFPGPESATSRYPIHLSIMMLT